ncbi:hypothetical protein CRYUN_Cryun30bG0076800 [Craigia yunnanensis]
MESGDQEMGLNQNLEAKQGTSATVIPGKKTLVTKRTFDQMVKCVTSGYGQCHRYCSGTSQSTKSEVSTEVAAKTEIV